MQKLSKRALLMAVFVFILLIGIIIAFFSNTNFRALINNPFNSSKLNILIIGYDSSINGPPRADTIILASIDLKTKGVGLLSIPRDTRVEIPGYGLDRINASHAYGGIELTNKTLESFLDVNIDYYVEMDFQGFARIIDAIGGVEIYIKEPLQYVDKAGGLYIDLPAGRQKLDGEKALQYVRYRDPTYGDIGRVERQQKFIRAVINRVTNPDIVVKLPSIIKETKNAVNTNIPFQDVSPFLHLARGLDLSNFKTEIVPGEPKYINGASYWIADEKALKILVNNLIHSKEYIENSKYRLTVLNGNGEPGLASELADEFSKYGFKISKIGNAPHFEYENTRITYYKKGNKKLAYKIKKLINGKVVFLDNEEKRKDEDVEIIIGANYLKRNE